MDKDVKNTILNMAESQLDEVLQMNGFKRRNNSLIYSRKCEGSIQKIEIMYFLHPSYYNHALAHIHNYRYIIQISKIWQKKFWVIQL